MAPVCCSIVYKSALRFGVLPGMVGGRRFAVWSGRGLLLKWFLKKTEVFGRRECVGKQVGKECVGFWYDNGLLFKWFLEKMEVWL